MKDQYFKIVKTRHDYLGERYFRYNHLADSVVQVCCFPGDAKKGKSNTFGVYIIHRITFLTNYLAQSYAEPCTKAEYNKQFDKVVKMLK